MWVDNGDSRDFLSGAEVKTPHFPGREHECDRVLGSHRLHVAAKTSVCAQVRKFSSCFITPTSKAKRPGFFFYSPHTVLKDRISSLTCKISGMASKSSSSLVKP